MDILDELGWSRERWDENTNNYIDFARGFSKLICECCGKEISYTIERDDVIGEFKRFNAHPVGCGCCGAKLCDDCYEKYLQKLEKKNGQKILRV